MFLCAQIELLSLFLCRPTEMDLMSELRNVEHSRDYRTHRATQQVVSLLLL